MIKFNRMLMLACLSLVLCSFSACKSESKIEQKLTDIKNEQDIDKQADISEYTPDSVYPALEPINLIISSTTLEDEIIFTLSNGEKIIIKSYSSDMTPLLKAVYGEDYLDKLKENHDATK